MRFMPRRLSVSNITVKCLVEGTDGSLHGASTARAPWTSGTRVAPSVGIHWPCSCKVRLE